MMSGAPRSGSLYWLTSVPQTPAISTFNVAVIRSHRSGVDVRWENKIGRALSELAILSVAREHDQPYEWSLHEMEAIAVGLDPAVIDIVRNRKPLAGIGDKETTIIE